MTNKKKSQNHYIIAGIIILIAFMGGFGGFRFGFLAPESIEFQAHGITWEATFNPSEGSTIVRENCYGIQGENAGIDQGIDRNTASIRGQAYTANRCDNIGASGHMYLMPVVDLKQTDTLLLQASGTGTRITDNDGSAGIALRILKIREGISVVGPRIISAISSSQGCPVRGSSGSISLEGISVHTNGNSKIISLGSNEFIEDLSDADNAYIVIESEVGAGQSCQYDDVFTGQSSSLSYNIAGVQYIPIDGGQNGQQNQTQEEEEQNINLPDPPSCINECDPASGNVFSEGQELTCGYFDADECLEYGSVTAQQQQTQYTQPAGDTAGISGAISQVTRTLISRPDNNTILLIFFGFIVVIGLIYVRKTK